MKQHMILAALRRSAYSLMSQYAPQATAIVGVMLMLLSAPVLALDSQAIFERSEPAVFQIRVINRATGKKSSIGSGFIFHRADTLATNYHVVSQFIEKPDTYELRYLSANGADGELTLIAVDAVHDLALVRAAASLGSPLSVGDIPAKGAALYAMGNPLDLGLTIAAGTNGGVLNQTDDSRILFSGSLNPGMSGGPTFDDQGMVVGINVATARNDISFIVPTPYLTQLTTAPPTPVESLSESIAMQIRDYQKAYLAKITRAVWPPTRIGQMQVPGAISPTIRCWDASPKQKPELLYKRLSISCQNENDIYLTDRLEVGKILYEYLWLTSDTLDPIRFYRLYAALNNSQFGSRANEEDVSNFACTTRFVDVNGVDFKTTLCSRTYKNHTGLTDILFTAAMVGKADTGFIFNIDISGTAYDAALDLIDRQLKEIRWQP